SRSSYAGNGVYKSTDKGKTWTHLGLDETHHISKVIIHPKDTKIVWVAALGHLYSNNPDRGIYKSIDGGKSWKLTLYVDEETGGSDLAIHPNNPDIIYAATWQKSRTAWHFKESGKGSGIYRSTNGGNTWNLLSTKESGFVSGEGAGRIGLDITVKDGKEYLYAVIDNNFRRPEQPVVQKSKGLSLDSLKRMNKTGFLLLKEKDIQEFLDANRYPDKYKAKDIIDMIKSDKLTIQALASYNDNANADLFDTPILGAEVYLSTDGGKKWSKTHEGYIDDLYYTYGYYFGQIRVQPNQPDKLYIYGVPIIKSEDGGKTWSNIDGDNVHSDHHSLWLNPNRPGHLINGNDGGVNISYDDGKNWMKCTNPEVGQFYYITTDNSEPYNVYGGVQDNGVWMGSHNYKNSTRWQSTGDYPYKSIMGGDGMQVQVDTRDNATIYAGSQFGNYFRLNRNKRERAYITPKHDLGKSPYRWNWQTPILLSSHNQDILYMGANQLLRSMDQGKSFDTISPDLTHGGKKGNVPFGTLTTIDESKIRFGLLYTGSDDGLAYVTRDGGFAWTKISDMLPQHLWVSRIQASSHAEGRVYVSLNGYRNDHFKPYVFVSDDFGTTWKNISANLPDEPVNVIKEDSRDEDVLYVGTDHGSYISLDRGASYMLIGKDIPKAPVHDIVIQRKSNHLLIGTHGRSIYKADISNIYEMKKKLGEDIVLFKPSDMRYNSNWGKTRNVFTEKSVPKLTFEAFASNDSNGTLELMAADGAVIKTKPLKVKKGINRYEIETVVDKSAEAKYIQSTEKSDWVKNNGPVTKADDGNYYIVAGKYELKLSIDKGSSKTDFSVKDR
ncbi:MAG: glycosyl hydrolase, partial [Saprospiraceae bacterium]